MPYGQKSVSVRHFLVYFQKTAIHDGLRCLAIFLPPKFLWLKSIEVVTSGVHGGSISDGLSDGLKIGWWTLWRICLDLFGNRKDAKRRSPFWISVGGLIGGSLQFPRYLLTDTLTDTESVDGHFDGYWICWQSLWWILKQILSLLTVTMTDSLTDSEINTISVYEYCDG